MYLKDDARLVASSIANADDFNFKVESHAPCIAELCINGKTVDVNDFGCIEREPSDDMDNNPYGCGHVWFQVNAESQIHNMVKYRLTSEQYNTIVDSLKAINSYGCGYCN